MKDFTERTIIPAEPGYSVIRYSRIDQEATIRHDPIMAWLIQYFECCNTGTRKRASVASVFPVTPDRTLDYYLQVWAIKRPYDGKYQDMDGRLYDTEPELLAHWEHQLRQGRG
jgi:hypothetical protein